ncbi:MAG TPA: hypothetical protein VL738_01830 [Dactylosporangium sp.]|jgi:hypothetical protein|nr:hypothetical protein [Dactylosporangium sp.]
MSGFDLLQTLAILLTALGVTVTAIQVRAETSSSKQARQAELSWSMYEAYIDPDLRRARAAVEHLANSDAAPRDVAGYQARIADGWPWSEHYDESLDAQVRRLLRFYNQLSILVEKHLIDPDFVFGLVGTGLVSVWPVLEPAIAYYQSYFGGPEGPDWQDRPRSLYGKVRLLHDHCVAWERREVGTFR